MTWEAVAALVLLGLTSLAVLATVKVAFARLLTDAAMPPRAVRRRYLRRMGLAIGLWQITVGLAVVLLGGMSASAIAPMGMGSLFLFGWWLSRRFNVAPWWAPNA